MTPFGLWLFALEREHFLPFSVFPFFRAASVDDVLRVELHGREHLYWPKLDVDLELDSLDRPDRCPLVARSPTATRRTTPTRTSAGDRPRGSRKGASSRNRRTQK